MVVTIRSFPIWCYQSVLVVPFTRYANALQIDKLDLAKAAAVKLFGYIVRVHMWCLSTIMPHMPCSALFLTSARRKSQAGGRLQTLP